MTFIDLILCIIILLNILKDNKDKKKDYRQKLT